MQLKVIKADGTVEPYLHTKVMGTFANALAAVGEINIFASEQLAEAVTYYLYRNKKNRGISSDQIHLIIQASLNSTGYSNAAARLNEHRLNRRLKRKRIEVVRPDLQNSRSFMPPEPWDKSRIARDLAKQKKLAGPLARTIASAVEEKVLNLGMSRVPSNLIEQLVLADTRVMLSTTAQLQTATA